MKNPTPSQAAADSTLAIATLGGGCFWCLEAVFLRLRGVIRVESGYSGGQTANPDYAQVCSGESGHVEVVRITFDTRLIRYTDLLEVFFAIHDPTSMDQQGNDIGSQYRSVIFTHNATQENSARQMIAQLDADPGIFTPIVTRILPAMPFYPAEDEHQDYYAKHPHQGYCLAVIAPKLVKFLRQFPERVR